jgi:hypothetical protein
MSGFAGYWLAPRIRTLVNGTLNVAPAILNAVPFIQHRVAERPDETYTAMLDRLGIDVFVGIRLPRATDTERPWTYTTTHLEGEPGWIALFRNMTTAVYLRDSARNADNLARVAHYYESVRVPFDPHEGFDPELVVRSNRSWAIDHGMLPVLFDSIASAAYGVDPDRKRNARDHLASIYATLGLYELAVELDRHALSERPDDGAVRRRLVWCLLRLRRASEAVELAEPLGLEAPEGSLAHDVALSAGAALDAKSDDELAALLAATPLFTRAEAARLAVGVRVPVARTSRR